MCGYSLRSGISFIMQFIFASLNFGELLFMQPKDQDAPFKQRGVLIICTLFPVISTSWRRRRCSCSLNTYSSCTCCCSTIQIPYKANLFIRRHAPPPFKMQKIDGFIKRRVVVVRSSRREWLPPIFILSCCFSIWCATPYGESSSACMVESWLRKGAAWLFWETESNGWKYLIHVRKWATWTVNIVATAASIRLFCFVTAHSVLCTLFLFIASANPTVHKIVHLYICLTNRLNL